MMKILRKIKSKYFEASFISKISLIVGIILSFISVITLIQQQKDIPINRDKNLKEIEKLKYEIKQLQIELKSGEPSFYVQYINMKCPLFDIIINTKSVKEDLHGILSSPVLRIDERFFPSCENIKLNMSSVSWNVNDAEHEYPESNKDTILESNLLEVNCLLIVQDGKRRADDVEIEMKIVNLERAVPVFTSQDTIHDFWENDIPKETGTTEIITYNLGSLQPGKSIMIPLFKTYFFYDKESDLEADLTLGIIYIPKRIFYKDGTTGLRNEFPIRKMLENNIIFDAFIKGRG